MECQHGVSMSRGDILKGSSFWGSLLGEGSWGGLPSSQGGGQQLTLYLCLSVLLLQFHPLLLQ